MADHLDYKLKHKIKLELFSYQRDLLRMSAFPGKNVAGVALGRYKVKMVSPNNSNTNMSHFKKMVVHEFNHVLVADLIKDHNIIQRWVSEGLAEMESGRHPMATSLIKSKAKRNKIPTLAELEKNLLHNDHKVVNQAYRWSQAIVSHMIETGGWVKFRAYLLEPWNVSDIYGANENGIWQAWVDLMANNG